MLDDLAGVLAGVGLEAEEGRGEWVIVVVLAFVGSSEGMVLP